MGDPAGIGPEVLIKSLVRLKGCLPATYLIVGDRKVLENCCSRLKIKNFFEDRSVELVDLNNIDTGKINFGKDTPIYGRAALEYLDRAIELLRNKSIVTLVTAPLSKSAVNSCGIKFQGHTEYLARAFGAKNILMLMVNKNLRVVPLTRHIALRDVPGKLNRACVYNGIKNTVYYLKKYYSISNPRIGVCALNPHSGEAGFAGKEEKEVIIPAITDLRRRISAEIEGPLSADGLFSRYKKGDFDCIVGMYHDQVLIPVKMSDYNRTVNLTVGLPFVRTSPAHGTAFDIAGRGVAVPTSMIEAIKLAEQLTRNAHH